MIGVQDTSLEDFDRLSSDMMDRLGVLVTEFSADHRLSGLSTTTLVARIVIEGLSLLGGPSALQWLTAGIDAQRQPTDRELARLDRKSRAAMERMAAHWDAQVAKHRGQLQ